MDFVFYQIGLSSEYQPYLVTTQLIGSNSLRRKEIPQINFTRHTSKMKSIPDDYLMKLVEGIQRVCKAAIKAKGGYFEESQI